MLDGKLGFDMRLQPTVDMGMRPIWRRLVSDAFFHGEMEGIATLVSYLADRKPWWRHSWGGDAFGSVDPEKELKTHQIGLETGQETLAMIAAERNADWKDLLVQRDTELREEIKLRVAREKMEMELREAAGLPMPGEEVESSEGKESKLGCVSVDEIRNAMHRGESH